jgi:ferredoxin
MSYAGQRLDTYPRTFTLDARVPAITIDALIECAQACTADADLSEQNVAELVKCIRLCLDCSDVCTATARVASRQTEYHAAMPTALAPHPGGEIQRVVTAARRATSGPRHQRGRCQRQRDPHHELQQGRL